MTDKSIITIRKDKIIGYLKNPYNLAFIAILIFGIIIRLKYLFINGTGIWWDEVGWLQSAKIVAGLSPEIFEPAKAPMFSLLAGFIFWAGGGENLIKIFLVFLPSVGTLVCIYFLGKEIFNRKVGLIGMSIMAVLSHHLFYEARVMGDMLANFLEILTITLFICFYVKKQKPHLLFIPVAIGIIGFLTRYSVAISLMVMFVYIILTERFSLFKDKHVWIATGVATVMFTIFGLINYSIFGNIWPAAWHYIFSPISGVNAITSAHGAFNLSFLYAMFDWLNFGPFLLGGGAVLIKSLVPMFIIGLSCLFGMFLGLDKILKKGNGKDAKELRPIFALFLWFAISAYSWIAIFHYVTPRWGLGIAPAVIVITAYGFFLLYEIIKKLFTKFLKDKNAAKIIATVIVGAMLFGGLSSVYERTDRMIESKAGSYDYLKPTSLWLQDNVPENETIMFPSYVWYQYYTQRDNFITDYNIKVAAFEHRNLTHLFLEKVPYGLIPVCEYDYEIAMRDTNIDYFVWTVGQQVWTPTTEYMNKAMSLGIFTGYANFNSGKSEQPAAWIFKVNRNVLNKKIDNLEYENQLIVMTTMEQWGPWNTYKQNNNITEKDICGYVYDKDGGKFYGKN